MDAGPESKWTRNLETGEWEPPELQQKYLMEMLLAWPPTDKTDLEWAAEHDVTDRTIRRWKSDERFRKLWAEKADDMHIGPDFIEPIIQNLHAIATSSQPQATRAAELLLKFTEKLRPPVTRVVVTEEDRVEGLSDAELMALIDSGVEL
jgi:hypothetical protein